MADRYRRPVLIAGVLLLWSGMTALSGMAQNFLQLALCRAGVGVGEGGSHPTAYSLISDYFPPARRAGALGLFGGVGVLGVSGAFLVGGFVSDAFGWRAAFFIAAAPGLVLSVIVLLMMREPPRGGFDLAQSAQLSSRASFASLARNAPFRWLIAGAALGSFANIGMLQWLPLFFMRSHDMDLKRIGILFGPAMAFGLMFGMLAGGPIADRLARRSLARPLMVCVALNVVVVPLYLLVLWIPSVKAALVLTFVSVTFATVWSPAYTAAMQNVCDPRVRGIAGGVQNVVSGAVAMAILPLAVGMLSDAFAPRFGAESLRWALSVAVLSVLLAAAAFARAGRLVHNHFAQLLAA
jgi:MFS transporter, Spinster family, sphingosine-1-phosphate transporter